jgi:hypothetical protein
VGPVIITENKCVTFQPNPSRSFGDNNLHTKLNRNVIVMLTPAPIQGEVQYLSPLLISSLTRSENLAAALKIFLPPYIVQQMQYCTNYS